MKCLKCGKEYHNEWFAPRYLLRAVGLDCKYTSQTLCLLCMEQHCHDYDIDVWAEVCIKKPS
jgi:hypothetical protein